MKVDVFIEELQTHGFGPVTGVPCSIFKDLINYLQIEKTIKHYICSSEGEAMGMAGGFALSGKKPVVYMQNDGLGNAINPLSSLQLLYNLPALLLISWRAKPGMKDAPQHQIMGNVLIDLLNIFKIPYIILNENDQNVNDYLIRADKHLKEFSTPYAFIISKGYFEQYGNKILEKSEKQRFTRLDYLEELKSNIKPKDIILGATGFSGRELYQTFNHNGKFYMMGSMGCLASVGLGIAECNLDRNIYVLDGDGALLMKMGTLSTVGYYKPKNFIHILFNNLMYESTGGQETASSVVNFSVIAENCGYISVFNVNNPNELKKILSELAFLEKPLFINISIKSGTTEELGRPSDSPVTMRNNLLDFLK